VAGTIKKQKKEEIMNFWLIQRAVTKTDKPSLIEGIGSFLSYDYMGSAEFEWGALPKALKEIIAKFPNLAIHESGLKREDGTGLFVIAKAKDLPEIIAFLNANSQQEFNDKYRLKERTDLVYAMTGDSRINCWWDINNGWFAIFGKQQAENLLLAIRKSKEKKEQNGK